MCYIRSTLELQMHPKAEEKMASIRKPHAVVVPFPVQGHINPMLHLAQKLASHGFIVTFITTHYYHSRTIHAHKFIGEGGESIRLRAIPDGLPDGDKRADFARLARVTENSMGPELHTLIHHINTMEEHKVTCLIADFFASWALEIANNFHIQTAAFWPGLIATYAIIYHMPTLTSKGTIPINGIPEKNEMVKYLPSMPSLCSANLPWLIGSESDMEFRFQFWLRSIRRFCQLRWILCNSFHGLEASIINMFPKEAGICPVGPLIPPDMRDVITEKEECLRWLDRQCLGSVIYVSFGSSIVLKETEVEHLALGLQATGRPFLWVVRGVEAYLPREYSEINRERGCMVHWAPQKNVLCHPAVGCFVTHCGWNSTLESITAGVPMVCRPCVADQFLNCAYIVDIWKIGLALKTNDDGIVEKAEIVECIRRIMTGEGAEIRERTRKLKECAVNAVKREGSSSINFNEFIKSMKQNIG